MLQRFFMAVPGNRFIQMLNQADLLSYSERTSIFTDRPETMRIILLLSGLLFFFSPKAQTTLPYTGLTFAQRNFFPAYPTPGDSSHINQSWYFSKYAGVSAGYIFSNAGGASFISAPFVLQLNHPLNKNLIAFANVSAAPIFFGFNHAFMNPAMQGSYPGVYNPNSYAFGMNAGIQMGLMYINDAKTFSISGSIGIESSSYPYFPGGPANGNFPAPPSHPGVRKK